MTTGSPSNVADKIVYALKMQKATRVVIDVRSSSLGVDGAQLAYEEVLRKSVRDKFPPPSEFMAIMPDGSVLSRP